MQEFQLNMTTTISQEHNCTDILEQYLHLKQKIFKIPDMKLFCCLNETGGISFFKHFLSISYKAIIFQEPLVFFHLCLQFFQPYILRSFNCPKSCRFLLFQDMI